MNLESEEPKWNYQIIKVDGDDDLHVLISKISHGIIPLQEWFEKLNNILGNGISLTYVNDYDRHVWKNPRWFFAASTCAFYFKNKEDAFIAKLVL